MVIGMDGWDIFSPQMLVSCSHKPQSLGFHGSRAGRLQGWGEGLLGLSSYMLLEDMLRE